MVLRLLEHYPQFSEVRFVVPPKVPLACGLVVHERAVTLSPGYAGRSNARLYLTTVGINVGEYLLDGVPLPVDKVGVKNYPVSEEVVAVLVQQIKRRAKVDLKRSRRIATHAIQLFDIRKDVGVWIGSRQTRFDAVPVNNHSAVNLSLFQPILCDGHIQFLLWGDVSPARAERLDWFRVTETNLSAMLRRLSGKLLFGSGSQ